MSGNGSGIGGRLGDPEGWFYRSGKFWLAVTWHAWVYALVYTPAVEKGWFPAVVATGAAVAGGAFIANVVNTKKGLEAQEAAQKNGG